MRRMLAGVLVLAAGLSLAQTTDYRQAAKAAAALARLEKVAQEVTGVAEERLLSWAKEVKARAEKSYEAKNYFKAAREAQAALLLFRATQGEPQVRAQVERPVPHRGMGMHHPYGPRGHAFPPGKGQDPGARLAQRAPVAVDRAEKELAYYRAQDNLVKDLVAEAKNRLSKEPGRAFLLAQAALALISAERGF
ncbi:hypothetical protein [Thermus caldifontis]|uniref:hypothetical protein n=1 Tax=Thermus caldifontis TaxID=1930763 RepID=UPI000DF456A5|nr:hypothetical protein [Thermus caldifontis]